MIVGMEWPSCFKNHAVPEIGLAIKYTSVILVSMWWYWWRRKREEVGKPRAILPASFLSCQLTGISIIQASERHRRVHTRFNNT